MNINASPDRTAKKLSPEESLSGKTNIFVTNRVAHINPKTMSLEYRQEVTSDAQYINRIFETNTYEHNYDGLVEFYSDVYYIMDTKDASDRRNVGTVVGMASLGVLGFAAFGITFIGGLAGIIFGGTLGRLVAGKISDMRRKKEIITQEELYLLKAKCMVELGTKQKKNARNDLNKFRLSLERIIEESSLTLETSLFQKPKQVNDIRLQLRNLLLDPQTQTAIELAFRLFQSFLERNDMNKPENVEKAAKKVYGVFIPYVKIIELVEIPSHAKDHPSLETYYRLKDFIAKTQIAEMLERHPEYMITQDKLDDFKIFLKQEVNLAEPMKRAVSRGRHPVTEHVALKRPSRASKSYGDNHTIEVAEKAPSNVDEESIVSCPSMKNFGYEDLGEGVTAYNADLYTSGLKRGFTPIASRNNLAATAPKEIVVNIQENHENPFANNAFAKKISLTKSTLTKSNVHKGDDDEEMERPPSKKNTYTEEVKLNVQSDQPREYIKLGLKSQENSQLQPVEDRSQLISLARSDQIDSPVMKRQSVTPTPKNQPSPRKQDSSPLTKKDSSPLSKKKSQESGGDAFEGNSFGLHVQNKVVFDRVLKIAYDNVSKWDRVINNPSMRIDKIKPEGSPVVLIRAWALIPGFHPLEVYEQIYNAEKRSKWDTVTTQMKVIEQIDETTSIIHFVIKAPPTITDRDFVQRRIFQMDYPEKGTITMGFQSFEHPKCPPVKNRIRGETHIAGYIMKPSEKDPNSTDMCLLTQVDIKGSIPKILVNMAAGKSPAEWINKLIKACEKARADNNKK